MTTFPLVAYSSEYVVQVNIGTPAVTLNLDFDTGSSDLWVWRYVHFPSHIPTHLTVYPPSTSHSKKKQTPQAPNSHATHPNTQPTTSTTLKNPTHLKNPPAHPGQSPTETIRPHPETSTLTSLKSLMLVYLIKRLKLHRS